MVPVELIFSTTVAIATLGLVAGLIAGISIIKIRKKRV
jgi:Na+/glutamate symporter